MSGAIDGIRPISPAEGATAKMAQASSLFAPEDETSGDIEMINISHKVSQSVVHPETWKNYSQNVLVVQFQMKHRDLLDRPWSSD